jgi:hypothetical protein
MFWKMDNLACIYVFFLLGFIDMTLFWSLAVNVRLHRVYLNSFIGYVDFYVELQFRH